MSIKKVTLASLILLSLTACSSGGSGGSSNNVAKPNTQPQTTQQQTTQQQTDKAAAEQAAKEKAEAERLAAEKAAKEKAEAERLAAEKAAKEKAEAERLDAEQAAKEKAEAERLAAEKAAKEKAEAERLAAEKETTERDILYKQAIAVGASENEANKLVDNRDNFNETQLNELLENYPYDKLKEITPFKFTKGYHHNSEKDYEYSSEGYREGSYQNLYNQKYSVVFHDTNYQSRQGWVGDEYRTTNILVESANAKGLKTEVLPDEGKAIYSGIAFDQNFVHDGFTYNVDFSNRVGQGELRSSNGGTLYKLEQGVIDNNATINASVQYKDNYNIREALYTLTFFGPNAEEIGGSINFDQSQEYKSSLGLSGTRSEIQK